MTPRAARKGKQQPKLAVMSLPQALNIGLIMPLQVPARTAREIIAGLPAKLTEHVGEQVSWDIHMVRSGQMAEIEEGVDALDVMRATREKEGWDVAIGLTTLPLRSGRRVIAGYAQATWDVVMISMPAVGMRQQEERVQEVIAQLMGKVARERLHIKRSGKRKIPPTGDVLARLFAPVSLAVSTDGSGTVRLETPFIKGYVQLMMGMVRVNRPWWFMSRLPYALVSTLATALVALLTTTVWRLSANMGWVHLGIIMTFALTAMVTWLVMSRNVWQRSDAVEGTAYVWLFNAVTLITVAIGVASMYALLFVATLLSALFIVNVDVLRPTIGTEVTLGTYVSLAWFVSSLALIGGVIGAGLENRVAVQDAAYRYIARTSRTTRTAR